MVSLKIKKKIDLFKPLTPNIVAAIPIISLFFLETFLEIDSIFRTNLVAYYLIIPFFPPISVIYLSISNHFKNYILITPIILISVCLFLIIFFNEYLWYFIHFCAFSVIRSLYNLNEIRNTFQLIVVIFVSLIINIIFKHLFLGSVLVFIYAFYNFINIKSIINSKKINTKAVLLTITSAYLASFGYGLIQSIDKVVTSNLGIFFYVLFLFSLIVSYFQNYYLNNINTRLNFNFRIFILIITIITYIILFNINNDFVNLFKLIICYFVLFIYSHLNAYLDRNALVIKNIFWFTMGLYIYFTESFTPNVKLTIIILSMIYFEIIHKFYNRNEKKQDRLYN